MREGMFPTGADAALFAVYTSASVSGLLMMKSTIAAARDAIVAGQILTGPVFGCAAGASLYVLSFVLWIVILGRNDLTVAYPIAVVATLVVSTLFAVIVLGEPMSVSKLAGIGLAILAIWLIVRG